MTRRTVFDQQQGATVSDSEKTDYERGAEMLREVYAGDVVEMPQGTMAFTDVMLESLFAKVWTRDVLSIRDRRLLIMGVIAAQGNSEVWGIQAKASLKRGELSPDELRETLVLLASYAGYPNVVPLLGECEGAIAAWQSEEA
jgi:4-carboxymuconolactone decarboxylase